MRVLLNRVLRKIFEPKRERERIIDCWREVLNIEVHKLHSSLNENEVYGHVSCMGVMRNAYKSLAGKLEEKNPLGRCKCKWENNIKTNLKEIVCEDADCIHLDQNVGSLVLW